ncbi:MAG: LysR family transcriptional regulator [Bacteroidetes bacterium]|nr:LysR family transcriptional regulator [Bacteroidota bacterium]MCL5025092.1 LysR family transcriptional regulator [Chloroflexota bacterium]
MSLVAPGHFYKQNRPQQLRGFYHVAVTGSFSVAAERMALGQPAVTLQVQALEQELQAKLFERKRGSIALTPEGQVLFEVAAPVVEALESLDEAFYERLGQFEAGEVRCAAPDNVVFDVLPNLVKDFNTRFPNIDLVLYSATSLQSLQMVLRGDSELGIGSVRQIPRNISFQPLAWYDNYLVVPQGHPLAGKDQVSLEDVAGCPLVAPLEAGKLYQDLNQAMERRGLHPHVVMRLASTEARLRYVQSGLGVTVAAGRRFPSEVARHLVWITLADHVPVTAYGLITRKNTYLSLAAKRFAEFVVQSAQAFQSLRTAQPE